MNRPKDDPKAKKPNYVLVFVALTVITIAEVGVTYLPLPRIPVLVPMAILKAILVVLFYMHLKYDNRIFTILFSLGLLTGISLLISMVILFAPALVDAGRMP
jgi:cytochrome c oxidase subunit IV